MFWFVDIGRGVVRSISASISEMSSEKPLVIVVSPVFDVLNWPPGFPCSEFSSSGRRRVKINRATTINRQSTTPDVTEIISTKYSRS